jgi:hypothetical protein
MSFNVRTLIQEHIKDVQVNLLSAVWLVVSRVKVPGESLHDFEVIDGFLAF